MAQNRHDDEPSQLGDPGSPPGDPSSQPGDPASPYDDSRIHPGWADQPQTSYDEAHSGGWGTPGHADTGPIRLSGPDGTGSPASAGRPSARAGDRDHPDDGTSSYGQDAFGQAGYVRGADAAPGAGATATADPRHAGPHETFAAPAGHHETFAPPGGPSHEGQATYGGPPHEGHSYGTPPYGPPPTGPTSSGSSLYAPPSYGSGSYDGPPAYGPTFGPPSYGPPPPAGRQPGQPSPRRGIAALVDFSFVSRATRALAPLLFWLVVTWGVVNVLNVIVTVASAPAFTRNGGTVFFAILTALFDALVKIALARLFLELCVNVSDLAERRAGERR